MPTAERRGAVGGWRGAASTKGVGEVRRWRPLGSAARPSAVAVGMLRDGLHKRTRPDIAEHILKRGLAEHPQSVYLQLQYAIFVVAYRWQTLLGGRIAWWPHCMVAALHGGRIALWPHCMVA